MKISDALVFILAFFLFQFNPVVALVVTYFLVKFILPDDWRF